MRDGRVYLRSVLSKNRMPYFVPILGELAELIERRKRSRSVLYSGGDGKMDTFLYGALPTLIVAAVIASLIIIYLGQNKTAPAWIRKTAFLIGWAYMAVFILSFLVIFLGVIFPYVTAQLHFSLTASSGHRWSILSKTNSAS